MVRNAKKDRDDIDKNKNQIRAIADFLQSLIQLPATPETVAVLPTPNLRVNDDTFETPKRTILHVSAETPFSTSKTNRRWSGMMMMTLKGKSFR